MIDPGRVIVGMLRLDQPEPGQWEQAARWVRPREAGGLELAGLLVFGGALETLGDKLRSLERQAGRRLLLCADYERGAGQQIEGLCELPHLMALGAARDPELCRRAAQQTAREAEALGVRLVFAPCLDLATEPQNPIIDVRAFSDDPPYTARLGRAWITELEANGGLGCAKHWPGHGAVSVDSHIARPVLEDPLERLEQREFVPFDAAFEARVASVMTAHLAAPALTGDPRTCVTVSARALERLRANAGQHTLIVSDALLMGGLVEDADEEQGGLAALNAGCDVLLAPSDPERLRARLERALEQEELLASRLEEAAARIEGALQMSGSPVGERMAGRRSIDELAEGAQTLADEIARRGLVRLRGQAPPAFADRNALVVSLAGDPDEVFLPFADELSERAPRVRLLPLHSESPAERIHMVMNAVRAQNDAGRSVAVVLGSTVRAWKRHVGLPLRERSVLTRLLEIAPQASVLALGSPRLLEGAECGMGFLGASLSDVPASQRALARALAAGAGFDRDPPLFGAPWRRLMKKLRSPNAATS